MKKGLFVIAMICFIFGFGITAVFACDEVNETYEVYGNINYSIAKYLPDCNGKAIQIFDGTFSGDKHNSEGYLPADGNVYAKDSCDVLDDGTVLKSSYTAMDFVSNGSFKEVNFNLDFESEIGSISEMILSEESFAKGTHTGEVKFDYNTDVVDLSNLCISADGDGYTVALRSEDGKYLGAETSSIINFDSVATPCIAPEITNLGTAKVQKQSLSGDDYVNTSGLALYNTGAGVRGTALTDTYNSGIIKTGHQTSISAFIGAKISRKVE
ncbi:hypothetical protein KAU09_00870 [Candidatus Parcubacteria bacterium]|nr:hypothetical protein [Candidatus Parcubacteria bacterium]